jgi:TrmH family RNA methyltransferase
VKLAEELLNSSYDVQEVYATGDWLEKKQEILNRRNIHYIQVSDRELARISQLSSPREVLLLVNIPEESSESIPSGDIILCLDQIQDPGNMGTIIRVADWFGISTVIASPGCADIYNQKVVQSTMGSITRVRVIEQEVENYLKTPTTEAVVYGAVIGGENIYDVEVNTPAIIIVGNESHGISPGLLPYVNERIGIPRWSKQAESLNAATATAIICSEFRRRQG